MKKSLPVIIVIVLVGCAYIIATWQCGIQIEALMNQQYKQFVNRPYIKVISRNYVRELLSSRETITFSSSIIGSKTDPILFTIHTTIKHGPLPDLSMPAVAVVDSDLEIEGRFKQDALEALGDKKLLSASTSYSFNRGAKSIVTMPAFDMRLSNINGGNSKIIFGGLNLDMEFSKDLARYSLHGKAPKFELDGQNKFVISEISFEGDQQRIFDNEPFLYSGTQKISIGELSTNFHRVSGMGLPKENISSIKQISLTSQVTKPTGGFIQVSSELGARELEFGDKKYGPVHYDFSLNHLHLNSLANFYNAYLRLSSQPAGQRPNLNLATKQLSQTFLELLQYDPEMNIDQFSIMTAKGEARLKASIRVNDISSSDLDNLKALSSKLSTKADISFPESFLTDLHSPIEQQVSSGSINPEERLVWLTDQGYITREAGLIKTTLAFTDSQFTLNGKPYVPKPTTSFNKESKPSIDDVDAVPYLKPAGRDRYREYLAHPNPKAFIISQDGSLTIVYGGDDLAKKGIESCQSHSSSPCKAYAVNNEVVWFTNDQLVLNDKPYAPKPTTSNVEIDSSIKPIPISLFKMGESLESVQAKIKIYGITNAQLNLHNLAQPTISFQPNGIILFFDSNSHLQTIRLNAPYPDKIAGIGIGDSLSTLKNTLGATKTPSWKFGESDAYLYPGNDEMSNRFDISNGQVVRIFLLRKPF